MATYNPPAPWAGPYPVAVVDNDTGLNWEAYGPNQLKKPTVVIQQADDCCLYTTEVSEPLVDGVDWTPAAFAPPGKSDGDTYLVCHPNGISMNECVGGVWVSQWQKCIQESLLYCPVGETDPANAILLPKNHIIKPTCQSCYNPQFLGQRTEADQFTVGDPLEVVSGCFTIPNESCEDICACILATAHYVQRVQIGWNMLTVIRLLPDVIPGLNAGFQAAHQENNWQLGDITNYEDEYGPRQFKMIVPPGGRDICASMQTTIMPSPGNATEPLTNATLQAAPGIFLNITTLRNDC